MSVIGSHEASGLAARLAPAVLHARARAWLADHSDDGLAQRTAGNAFLIRVASAVLVYLTQVLLARWMGEFEFGIYVYVWTWVLLVGALVDFGLASAAQRFIPEYIGLRTFALLRGFLSGSRWLALSIATVMAGFGALGIWLFAPWIGRYEIVPLYLACVAVPLFALAHVQEGIARAYGWVNLALLPPYVVRSLALVAVIAVAHAAGFAANATTAMTAAVIATWVTALLQLAMLDRRLGATVEPGPKAYEAATWFLTAIPIFMVEGFYFLLTYTDVLVLQQFRPPQEVAVYYAAAKTLALVAFVHYSVAAATTHKFTEYHVRGDRAQLAAFLSQSIRWTFWPSLAATAAILALGRPFLWLFGPSFLDGYSLMFILAVGPLARAAIGPVERLLNMVGEQRACALVYGGAFAFNLAACLVLIPPLGIHGAAVATAAAVLVESTLLFVVTKRRLGLHVFIWSGPKRKEQIANSE
ncbi:MAG TPA: lipopolysaccharide biosynthesis protein [Xanthobacteraceae bacterium]|nr:lipopolysaccharide biosynthesis protein [Xanthobacteraceae bacterium]